jgi:hypothetical protein
MDPFYLPLTLTAVAATAVAKPYRLKVERQIVFSQKYKLLLDATGTAYM